MSTSHDTKTQPGREQRIISLLEEQNILLQAHAERTEELLEAMLTELQNLTYKKT